MSSSFSSRAVACSTVMRRFRARERNAGWRIDYFLVSDRIADKIQTAAILMDVMGSDHCPVELDINL